MRAAASVCAGQTGLHVRESGLCVTAAVHFSHTLLSGTLLHANGASSSVV
jgi:hypothetical protein